MGCQPQQFVNQLQVPIRVEFVEFVQFVAGPSIYGRRNLVDARSLGIIVVTVLQDEVVKRERRWRSSYRPN